MLDGGSCRSVEDEAALAASPLRRLERLHATLHGYASFVANDLVPAADALAWRDENGDSKPLAALAARRSRVGRDFVCGGISFSSGQEPLERRTRFFRRGSCRRRRGVYQTRTRETRWCCSRDEKSSVVEYRLAWRFFFLFPKKRK